MSCGYPSVQHYLGIYGRLRISAFSKKTQAKKNSNSRKKLEIWVILEKNSRNFRKNSRMTSFLLSNNDVIGPDFLKKTQDKFEKTQFPGNLSPPINRTISEILSLYYMLKMSALFYQM